MRVVELWESKVGDKKKESLYFQRRRFVCIHCFEAEARMAGFKVVEEENNDDDCVKPSPLKRCTPPPKQLPPK